MFESCFPKSQTLGHIKLFNSCFQPLWSKTVLKCPDERHDGRTQETKPSAKINTIHTTPRLDMEMEVILWSISLEVNSLNIKFKHVVVTCSSKFGYYTEPEGSPTTGLWTGEGLGRKKCFHTTLFFILKPSHSFILKNPNLCHPAFTSEYLTVIYAYFC